MDNKSNNCELQEQTDCIERVVKLFLYDTLILVDCVLADDLSDPEYSAISTYKRLEDVWLLEKACNKSTAKNVFAYLKEHGYSDADVAVFEEKMQREAPLGDM